MVLIWGIVYLPSHYFGVGPKSFRTTFGFCGKWGEMETTGNVERSVTLETTSTSGFIDSPNTVYLYILPSISMCNKKVAVSLFTQCCLQRPFRHCLWLFSDGVCSSSIRPSSPLVLLESQWLFPPTQDRIYLRV